MKARIKKIAICGVIGVCGYVCAGNAACPLGDELLKTNGLKSALPVYETCALQTNDDDTQLYLAQLYERGQADVSAQIGKALLFYHLSAENGNATAQVGLSKLLTRLDEKDDTRAQIKKYLDKIQGMLAYRATTSFKGQLLHPYTLLLLAAEKPEAKWFYPTKIKTDKTAAIFLKQYKITPDKEKASYAEATNWKQRKMKDIAQDVFSEEEYETFYNRLYPASGSADNFDRTRAIQDLKDKLTVENK